MTIVKSPPVSVGEEIEVLIEKITPHGGRGLARYGGGYVVFVPFSVSGDRLKVRIVKANKNFSTAEIIEVLSPSMIRKAPACEYFGRCGGCSLQMLDVTDQEKEKQGFIKEMLSRLGLDSDTVLKPFVSSPKAMRYRNRIQLHQKGQSLGYYQKESHTLVPISDCLITDETITKEFESYRVQNSNRRFELSINQDGQTMLTHESITPDKDKKGKNKSKKSSKSKIFEEPHFSQVNEGVNYLIKEELNLNLKTLTQENCESVKTKNLRALDLYAGSGNFTEIIKAHYSKVEAVEFSASSVKRGKELFPSTDFFCQKVETFLKQVDSKYDLIFVDPPRLGLSKVVLNELLRLKPKNVIYLSCNLSTLERDLKGFMNEYKLLELRGFDMFPQTSHVETLVCLTKIES